MRARRRATPPLLALGLLTIGCGQVDFAIGPGADAAPGARCQPVAGDNDDDGDGLVDRCDPCPLLPAPAAQAGADGDGDGVGDACDPSSGLDRQRVFDPFLGDALDPRWRTTHRWQVGASVLTGAFVGGGGNLGYVADPARSQVSMRGVIDAVGAGPIQVSLQFGQQLVGDADYCEIYGDPSGPSFKLMRYVDPTFTELGVTVVPALTAGTTFTMTLRSAATGLSCDLTLDGQAYRHAAPTTVLPSRDFTYLQVNDLGVALAGYAEVQPAP